ncbi:DUF2218 domain-containing protein [Actinoallomurus sp. CA-150999]|uniref:DUF2218 domain-containing protein n=1 Tax=Actinoallomurus sp. CA-150999 TaxID=3239887 RepID=UPI003D943C95
MPTSQATIEIDRPGRYLAQFCGHAAAMGRTGGGHRRRSHGAGAAGAVSAEWSDTHGIVTIAPWGRCSLEATDHTLNLRVDATDEDALRRIQEIVTRDLERFGRREKLTVAWQPTATESGTG